MEKRMKVANKRLQGFYHLCRCAIQAELLKYICPHVDVIGNFRRLPVLQVADLPQQKKNVLKLAQDHWMCLLLFTCWSQTKALCALFSICCAVLWLELSLCDFLYRIMFFKGLCGLSPGTPASNYSPNKYPWDKMTLGVHVSVMVLGLPIWLCNKLATCSGWTPATPTTCWRRVTYTASFVVQWLARLSHSCLANTQVPQPTDHPGSFCVEFSCPLLSFFQGNSLFSHHHQKPYYFDLKWHCEGTQQLFC